MIIQQHKLFIVRRVFIDLVTIALMLTFSYAVFSRVQNMKGFIGMIKEVDFLQHQPKPFAWTILLLMFTTVSFLLFARTRRWGLALGAGLLLLFSIYIARTILVDARILCSCAGLFESWSWPEHLLFNIILATVTIVAFILSLNQKNESL